MGSDMHMNPPQPVYHVEEYDNLEDVLLAIAVIMEGETEYRRALKITGTDERYILSVHTGRYS